MTDRVTFQINDGIAAVHFNRPDKRNALDGEQFKAIYEVGERIKTEAGVRVVVVAGEGESFCAGLDFSMFGAMLPNEDTGAGDSSRDRPGVDIGTALDGHITHLAQQVCWVWQEIEVPVIMAVHGHALGGGLQIALGGDIRVAHPDTKWSVREIHWGLIPDMTGTFMLSRLVRNDIARELALTGRILGGDEAERIGLVTRSSTAPRQTALEIAGQIAARNPDAVRGVKRLYNNMFSRDAAEQFALEREVIHSLIGTPNQAEAVISNLENRQPTFSDVESAS